MPSCQAVKETESVTIGRQDMDYKFNSGAMDGRQCEDRFGEGSLTLHLFPYSSPQLFLFSPCAYSLLPKIRTSQWSTHPEYRIVLVPPDRPGHPVETSRQRSRLASGYIRCSK